MKLLVAYDGSRQAKNALEYATTMADALDASVTIVYVVDPAVHDLGGSGPVSTFAEADERLVMESLVDAEQRGMDILGDAARRAELADEDIETELLYGRPGAEIAEFAESRFDGIYVGHQGWSGRSGELLGSVAKTLVERATVPVTVVR